jgi:hypothetical protein
MSEHASEYTMHETGDKHLAYATEFRAMLKEHPGIIGRALEMMDEAVAEYNPAPIKINDRFTVEWNKEEMQWYENDAQTGHVTPAISFWQNTIFFTPNAGKNDEESGLMLSLIGVARRKGIALTGHTKRQHVDYFKARVDNKDYFVKRAPKIMTAGFDEFRNTIRAKELLHDLDFVKVVEPRLGYSSESESIYVSSWEEIETGGFVVYSQAIQGSGTDNYGRPAKGVELGDYDKVDRIAEKYKLIEEKLQVAKLATDLYANTFVNPKTEKFILIDIVHPEDEHHGGPLEED